MNVVIKPLEKHKDSRGWLAELFRQGPVMGYASVTEPGITRGPHEHKEQTDCFAFLDGDIELHLWQGSEYKRIYIGNRNPSIVVVPPGVVHAYRNIGTEAALILNFPDRLYDPENPDEIRHENNPESPYKVN